MILPRSRIAMSMQAARTAFDARNFELLDVVSMRRRARARSTTSGALSALAIWGRVRNASVRLSGLTWACSGS